MNDRPKDLIEATVIATVAEAARERTAGPSREADPTCSNFAANAASDLMGRR